MKNIVLGMICGFFIIYIVVIGLSISNYYTRQNEINKCVSTIMYSKLQKYYDQYYLTPAGADVDNQTVSNELVDEITKRINSNSTVVVDVLACDIEKGIISVDVKERFKMPTGVEKMIDLKKVIIVDKE